MQLDTYSFDKVLSKFKTSIVRFDVAFPYGDKHDAFAELSSALTANPQILVATVGVKDYGDKDNVDVAERYKVVKEDYPVLFLFKEGNAEPIRYKGEFKKDEMLRFVRQTSGEWIGLPGCSEKFDSLAKLFVEAKQNPSDRKVILRQAEDAWDQVSLASDRKSAEVYVKIMRKMIEKGDDFLKSEQARVEGLRQGKLSQEKKDDMERRLNILQSFQPLESPKKPDQKNTEL